MGKEATMKKLVILVVVALVGLVGYNYATTGEFRLVPDFSKSDEEHAVEELAQQLDQAKKQFTQAHRTAATSGLDTTADVEAARVTVKRIEKELKSLRAGLSEEKAERKAEELAAAVRAFAAEIR
jgi:Zn-dependent oligopeptidase